MFKLTKIYGSFSWEAKKGMMRGWNAIFQSDKNCGFSDKLTYYFCKTEFWVEGNKFKRGKRSKFVLEIRFEGLKLHLVIKNTSTNKQTNKQTKTTTLSSFGEFQKSWLKMYFCINMFLTFFSYVLGKLFDNCSWSYKTFFSLLTKNFSIFCC